MQCEQNNDAESLLCAAIDFEDAGDRKRFLDSECGDNAELREQVEQLVAAHFDAGDFLQHHNAEETLAFDDLNQIGSRVGQYKLLEKIGEGGMGVVYVAVQQNPICRTVALKLIKPGMDSRQVIARFNAERQALAMMNHPHIAKVLDAGATESGRPYFVMELVKGIPITDFCDQHQLDLPQRLELFRKVCEAVQHAHQKGIIHRDLKPTNILVELEDVRAAPKVIGFGVAKAMRQALTENSLQTGFHQIIGTPMYMSPEQAQLNSLDVDTRSDIPNAVGNDTFCERLLAAGDGAGAISLQYHY